MSECYRFQWIKCGNPRCRACPHGPYWYGFTKKDGKTRSRYIGKTDPRPACEGGTAEKPKAAEPKAPPPHRFDAILDGKKASFALACEILEVKVGATLAEGKASYRKLCMKHHPDRGGEVRMQVWINAAWAYFRSVQNR